MSRLFDRQGLQSFFVLVLLRFLRLIRTPAQKAARNGWRKVAGIFVRNEYSKFILGVFRLDFCGGKPPADRRSAAVLLVERLYLFLEANPELHWSVEEHRLIDRRRDKPGFYDIVVARVGSDGSLESLTPFFDPKHPPLLSAAEEQFDFILRHIMTVYNALKFLPAARRARAIRRTLRDWTARNAGFDFILRFKLSLLIERIMSAVFVYCEELPEESTENYLLRRYRTPGLTRFRHPGWGMICIMARFSCDLREVDLWWQFNHVTTDGAPMQEILGKLKREWGAAGPVVFPPLRKQVSAPELIYCSDGLFRARVYADFSSVMRIRDYLNAEFREKMGGSASFPAMLIWGLSAHPFFRTQKFMLPVDVVEKSGRRDLELIAIRPGLFRLEADTEQERFFAYMRAFNSKIELVRHGFGEVREFLELCAVLHPFLYHVGGILAAAPLREILGTVGFTVIRDAEVFIAPMTDFQVNGFLSLGSVNIATDDGRHAGSLCMCGTKKQVRAHLEAVGVMFDHIAELER